MSPARFFHNLTGGSFGRRAGDAPTARPIGTASSGGPAATSRFVADLTVALLGGGLKTKQKLTGRLADALSELYMLVAACSSATRTTASPPDDRHIVALAAQNGLYRFQEAMRGTIDNFPVALGALADARRRVPARARTTSRRRTGSATRSCELVLQPGEVRDRLTRFIFVSQDVNDPTGLLEVTLAKVVAAEAAEKKLDRAIRAGMVRRVHGIDWIGDAAKPRRHHRRRGAAAARGRSAHRARHRRRPFRSGRGEAALHDARAITRGPCESAAAE